MIRRILVIASVILLFLMAFSNNVIGKGWLSEQKIKQIAAKAAHHAKYYVYEGGRQKIQTRKLDYDYIDVSPTITHIPADTSCNHFRIIRYIRKMPAGDFVVGQITLDVYGGEKVPGGKGVIPTRLELFSNPFDEKEAKRVFKEKTGEDVCIIFLAHWSEKCESGITSPLGVKWEWLIVDNNGVVYTMRLPSWEIKSFPDMAKEREKSKERGD
ncbi:hypothetical protein AMJ44_15195 [candidate division WOR-1 bacterium DG_54_3]|uniref:Uncharacterized protein n=1 Tax=candidate division WOR-1 bacterium DG_54_3 TaxID=1703775 RepID=A0A0S7XK01_UNCSA|nr:MAG: hypothetical protein AMJ44_15195 [candidate division WOR-1 bacterium DG_54_3]